MIRKSAKSPAPKTPKRRLGSSPSHAAPPASALSKVASGRVQKTPRKKTPAPSSSSTPTSPLYHEEGKMSDVQLELEKRRFEMMQEEKEFFPHASEWHEDEARLFEILYMRQYSPLLPSFWEMDFKGLLIPEVLFLTSEERPPIIYSVSGQDYHSTKKLVDLMELTAVIRGYIQADRNERATQTLKKALVDYIHWAAVDGGYATLDIIPNILVEVVDVDMAGEDITQWMRDTMNALAQRHRDHLRVEDEDQDQDEPPSEDGALPSIETEEETEEETEQEAEGESEFEEGAIGFKSRQGKRKALGLGNDGGSNDPAAPPARPLQRRRKTKYSRAPPVIYALFLIRTTIMILTADAGKEGADFHMSYQIELSFSTKDQGMWNALTTAIIVCQARDGMIQRKDDFEESLLEVESDPDA